MALCFAVVGCDDQDQASDSLVRDAQAFANDVAKDTDSAAFRITLVSRDGTLAVGDNLLIVHVGFHDPNDPLDPGLGIPDARISLMAWMPLDDGLLEHELHAEALGEGRYLLDPIELDRAGVWQLDLDVDVGATMRENVSFAFLVEG